jgi:L-fuconate dehydratase
MSTIVAVDVVDVRFPTSLTMDGSDAMNKDGDYSAAYVILRTDEPGLNGYGFTFTIGRGNDICVLAAKDRALPLLGRDVDTLVGDLGAIYAELKADSQLRWLGPEKGVEHLAMAAVMNALWDLAARKAGKPLWRLLADMTPSELVDVADLTYLSDALTRDEAIALLEQLAPTRSDRVAELAETGYPCYTTSAGWLGYSDEKLRRLCQEAVDAGYKHIKLKVGSSLADDVRRLGIAREVIGHDVELMIDANQVWDVPEAIEWVNALAEFKPLWIEEPTSPDDILGHATIRRAVAPIGVATGEHGMNRVLFKQMFQAQAIDFCQLDAARLASINEILAVYLMESGSVSSSSICPSSTTSRSPARSRTGSPSTSTTCMSTSSRPASSRRGRMSCRPNPATALRCTSPPSTSSPFRTAATGPALAPRLLVSSGDHGRSPRRRGGACPYGSWRGRDRGSAVHGGSHGARSALR